MDNKNRLAKRVRTNLLVRIMRTNNQTKIVRTKNLEVQIEFKTKQCWLKRTRLVQNRKLMIQI